MDRRRPNALRICCLPAGHQHGTVRSTRDREGRGADAGPAPYGHRGPRWQLRLLLHIKDAYATGGCVARAAAQLGWLLTRIRFSTAPVVSIGLGATPYGVIPKRYV